MGGSDYTAPVQPGYGDSMREALDAQIALLTGEQVGESDFRNVGKMEDIVRKYEKPLRETTAQIDTDVMRQTLLGSGSGEKYAEDGSGRIITGYESSPQEGQYKVVQDGSIQVADQGEPYATFTTRLIDVTTGKEVRSSTSEKFRLPWNEEVLGKSAEKVNTSDPNVQATLPDAATYFKEVNLDQSRINDIHETLSSKFTEDFEGILSADQIDAVVKTPRINALQISNDGSVSEAKPIFKQENGVVIVHEDAEPGAFVKRTGDGMVDLVGDKRKVQEQVSDYASYVNEDPQLKAAFQAENEAAMRRRMPQKTIEEWGQEHYETIGQAEGRELGLTLQDTEDQAGFRDGQFMGLSALAEDIGRGSQQRAREADIADVERLGGRATDAYRAQGDLSGALQTARGMGAGGSEGMSAIPTDPLFGTSAQGTLADRTARENLGISAIAGGRMGDYDPRATTISSGFENPEFQGPQQPTQPATGTDAFRSALMADARGALDQGLTAREKENIEQAMRARATGLGRTFDSGSIEQEVQSKLLEDRNRQMQNRAYAQSVLGGEVGIQQADMSRGLQAQQLELGRQSAGADRILTAEEKDIERAMRRDAMQEQYRQQGLGAERASAMQMVGLEQATSADPFAAILQRQGQNNLGAGSQLFSQAGYGLQSGPQYLNPEAGLGFIQNQATNAANMYNAQVGADATKTAGMWGGLGALGGGLLGGAGAAGGFKKLFS